MRLLQLRCRVAGSLAVLLSLLLLSCNVALATNYAATVDTYGHGLLTVVDGNCQHHILGKPPSGLAWDKALFAWGSQHYNVFVVTRRAPYSGDESLIMIYPREGKSFTSRCGAETKSFDSSIDGVIIDWSEGNALGSFDVRTASGAIRQFTFRVGKEPTVNGHRMFCMDYPSSPCNPDDILRPGQARARIFYKVIDAPDGSYTQATRIVTFP